MKPVAKAITYTVLGLWSFICVFPIYWVLITSFKSIEDIDKTPGYLPFVDFAPSLEAWHFILFAHNENLVSRFINSAVIAGSTMVLTVIVSSMAIYGLTRFPATIRWASMASAALGVGCGLGAILEADPVPRIALLTVAFGSFVIVLGSRRWGPVMTTSGATTLMLATRVLPPAVIALPLYILAIATGLRDTLAVMVLVYAAINLPVAIWLLLPVIGPRATEQEEAAQLDGATHLEILFNILLPMVRVSIAATGLIVFLLCWNEYLFAAYLTADHALTLPPWAVGQLSMKEAQVGGGAEELAHLSAATILMMLPALAVGAYAQQRLSHSVSGK